MKTFYDSPIGRIVITAKAKKISSIIVSNEPFDFAKKTPSYLKECIKELEAYFNGGKEYFSMNLDWDQGTLFQQKVWQEIANIPYGQTTSYLKIAEKISTKKAVRAVGTAVGRNPFFLVNPCHRVIGTDGKLRGFAYGLETKRYLLELEKSKLYGVQSKLF